MIQWTPKKTINFHAVQEKLLDCIATGQFTNSGKYVKQLQEKIQTILQVHPEKCVVLTCNGTMALNALVSIYNYVYGRKLKFAVQSFTFPCSNQLLLKDSIIVDIDDNMGPNINSLETLKDLYDGVIITNCFGCSVNIEKYVKFCKVNNKLLLFDNAAAPYTFYKGENMLNYGDGCFVSLHHTKPLGFGEGGFLVIDKQYQEIAEKIISFGYTPNNRTQYEIDASNFKMSEISAIYIDQWLDNFYQIQTVHKSLIEEIKKYPEIRLFPSFTAYDTQLMNTIPVIFSNEIDIEYFKKAGIDVKKYYYPLAASHTVSKRLFETIICFPLHIDCTVDTIKYYVKVICNVIH